MPPAISVVLPYRDAADTIVEALESVLAQTEGDLEIVAVDDGSTDAGPALVARIASSDARVVLVRATCGTGITAALRDGLAAARGPLVARMDADDVARPERLALQRELLESDPRLGVVGAQVEGFSRDGPLGEGLLAYIAWQNALVTPEDHARDLFVEAPLCHPSTLLRREALDAVGGFRDVPWAEDYDLWLRLDAAGWRMAKVPRVLLAWRHHARRATFTSPAYGFDRLRAAKARFLAPRLRARDLPLCVWGAGQTGRRFARALEAEGIRASLFIDIDPRKIGRTARGAPIRSPDALVRGAQHVLVAVGARGGRAIVRAKLGARGLVEGADFTCVA